MSMDGLPVVTKADDRETANPPRTYISPIPQIASRFPPSRCRFPPIALRGFTDGGRASSAYPTASAPWWAGERAGRESGAGLFSRDGGGEGGAARARGARVRAVAGRPRLRRPARPRRPPRPPRLRRLPARAARAGRGRARRPRLAGRDAHRRRQEPLLPAPRARLGQAHHRGQPADRADGRPVAAALGRRPPGGDDRLGPPGGGGARRDGADPRRPGPDRLLLAGALRPARLHERGRPARGRPARRRRGPLHLRVGPRLPPRLPAAAAGARAARPPDGDGLHRDRDRGRLEPRSPSASASATR